MAAMAKFKRKIIPVEELVEIMCTVRGERIIGMCPTDNGWVEQDITAIVHPDDRDRLLTMNSHEHQRYWHRVGREMRLW